MKSDKFKGHLELLILTVLKNGAAHGYLVSERLRIISDQYLDYPEGTIYPALHKLEGEGMISSTWSAAEGRRRRVYKITKKGSLALSSEIDDWRKYVSVISAVLESKA